ncbi:MAG: acetyltransferase [Legionellales bacterium RIFCSPHIGHO2_12_FULL_35_11]|nr:MAG: acetyltransferase [Legionellales bacterium RIFCSPHIGHO2_12_FULL_35_11]
MTKPKDKKIVIEGVTPSGKAFRPSDWAERMSGTMASFKNSRIHYSPLLQPSVNHEGFKCVLLDPKLKESSPEVYQSILDFAKDNNLKICNDSEDETS